MVKQDLALKIPAVAGSPSIQMILLADDDLDDCLLFREAFDTLQLPADLAVVNDGEQLMNYLHTSPLPHLLFLDLNMPRKNGYECLSEIKACAALKDLPVLILSTSANTVQMAQAIAGGAVAFYSKPVTFTLLVQMLKEAMHFTVPEISPVLQESTLLP